MRVGTPRGLRGLFAVDRIEHKRKLPQCKMVATFNGKIVGWFAPTFVFFFPARVSFYANSC